MSFPSDAQVTVQDRNGDTVAMTRTPGVVTRKRGDGFLKRARYVATFEKPGYEAARAPIESRLNPWIFGNVVFGGLVGLAVDPYTGAMWEPAAEELNRNLTPMGQYGPEDDASPATHHGATAADGATPQ